MSDLQSGRRALRDFQGFVACGGFSYGDVLGAGQGWAEVDPVQRRAARRVRAFFARSDTFALGVCNGCQMMAHLASIIPGAEGWPSFQRNRSEQFEARFVMVELPQSPSMFFAGMAGSRMPIVVSHGEGRAVFAGVDAQDNALVAMRYVDNDGAVAKSYPFNPNGSPDGIAGVTTPDGRFTIMMPHPERVFRTVQMSWAPASVARAGCLAVVQDVRQRAALAGLIRSDQQRAVHSVIVCCSLPARSESTAASEVRISSA